MSIITLLVLYDIVQYHVYNRKHVYNNNIKGYQQSIEFSLSYHTFLSLPIHCGTVVLNELPNWIHPNKLKNQLQYVDSFLLNSSKTVSVLGMNVPPYRLPVGLVLLTRHVIHLALCFFAWTPVCFYNWSTLLVYVWFEAYLLHILMLSTRPPF